MTQKLMPDGTVQQLVAVCNQSGQYGVRVTTGTTAITGNYSSIQVLADATFTSLTESNMVGDSMAGIVIPAGTVIFGNFTGYQLASGKVRAYA